MMVRLVEALGGQLLITAHGDRTLKLSKKAMEKLKKLSKRLGKTPSEVVEDIIYGARRDVGDSAEHVMVVKERRMHFHFRKI